MGGATASAYPPQVLIYQGGQSQQLKAPVESSISRQPGTTAIMKVDPRNAMNLPFNRVGNRRDWSHGLCDCTEDCGTCCIACIAPCFIYASNKSRLDYLNFNDNRPRPGGGESCNCDCFLHGLLLCWGCNFILQMFTRGHVRNRYRIAGNDCGDCCTAFWCTPCELTQEKLEIDQEEQAIDKNAG